MQKIGNITPTADANGEWTNGNVAAGTAPTILDAAWLNTVQRELSKVVTGGGLVLDPADDTQVLAALKKIFLQTGNNLSEILAAGSVAQSAARLSLGIPDSNFAGRLLATRSFGSSTSYTPTAGTKTISVKVIGGGGGGGGAAITTSGNSALGGGGGSGGYAFGVFLVSALSFPVTITIGAAGAQGGTSGNAGGTGGSTTFGSYMTATGGAGGAGGASVNYSSYIQSGGSGGVGSGGLINSNGSPGAPGIMVLTNGGESGSGGSSAVSGGGGGSVGNSAGNNGGLGAGGAGAISQVSTTYRYGGFGGYGVVIVEEYS